MKTYTDIVARHEEHMYKRGRYMGDAPADPARRSKNHFRIIKKWDGVYAVRFHSTDILTYYPDGTVIIDAGGWESSPTTRDAFAEFGVFFGTVTLNKYKNTCVGFTYRSKEPVPYVPGMTYNTFTKQITHPHEGGEFVLKRYVSDREARKAFSNAAAPFRAMLPILAAAHNPHNTNYMKSGPVWYGLADQPHETINNPDLWPQIVATFWSDGGHKAIWRSIYNFTTQSMRNVESTVVNPNK